MIPYRETSPYVGFTPTTPQSDAGCRTEPPVSVPHDHGAPPAATIAAGPPLEPPGTAPVSHGFFVGPYADHSVDEPIANSSRFSLPRDGSPAPSHRSTTVAEYGGTKFSRIFEPIVVVTPSVQKMSL